ncbi:DoxX family protein [Poseidonocella sedimentorum]|uniref:DoxX-like family protein n=1 Tax=Poseidonocella sedimentorum TaxID=871652 RepID=A0A1I6CYG5_9RHOB|nr:DoxX family protein [Poseidonocella sedimentorum]SFQ98182.1 DoxX-like family protein [Poseidonocella sedimentorum]
MTTLDTNPVQTNKGWTIGLWIAQALLAAMFLMAGATKLTSGSADLVAMGMGWAENAPFLLIKFIGLAEVAGALGLILPAATRIMPGLTTLAAAGLAVIMVLASGLHIIRGEFEVLPINAILFALAAFVVWGRTKKAAIAPRA